MIADDRHRLYCQSLGSRKLTAILRASLGTPNKVSYYDANDKDHDADKDTFRERARAVSPVTMGGNAQHNAILMAGSQTVQEEGSV